jgi:hypothetical protein
MMRKVMENSSTPKRAKNIQQLQQIDSTLNTTADPVKEIKDNYT